MEQKTERMPACVNCEDGNIIVRSFNAIHAPTGQHSSFFGVFAYCERCGHILSHELRGSGESKLHIKSD